MPLIERLLAEIGYQVRHYHYRWLERSMAQVNCVSDDEETLVELHWRPFHRYEWDNIVPLSEYWSNVLDGEIDGVRVRFLSNEMLFIYLCLLLCKETQKAGRIRYLLDLHYFLSRHKDSLDCKHLTEIISGYGLKPYISLSLDCLEEGFGSDYGIRKRLLGSIRVPALKRIYFKLVMDRKQKITPEGSSKQKQVMVNIFLFSKGSLRELVNKFYLTGKASYLRWLENSCRGPSINILAGYFLRLYKNL